MSNHVHLLLHHPATVSLESIFRHINTPYACWFNAKYDRTGFVQDCHYFSEPVDSDNALLTVLRYIHYNPAKAGLEKSPGSGYQWSSYNDYTGRTGGLTDTAFVLRLLDTIVLLHKRGISIRQLNRLTGTPRGVIDRIISHQQS